MKTVFAIVVTYNGMKWIDHCLGSLKKSSTNVPIIVVDNASTDETVDYIKEHFQEVKLIISQKNLGFAKANNVGIRYAIDNGADFVFLLNQDAWVEKDTISNLIQTFEDNDRVGIASPIHLNGLYTALDFGFASYLGPDFASDAYMQQIKTYYQLAFVNAAAWMISKKCIETVGGFDTMLFFHYGEDCNYCQRVVFHDFKILLNTRCSICHDREDRRNNDYKFKKIAKQQVNMEQYLYFGDVNKQFELDKRLKQIKKKRLFKIITFRFNAAKRAYEELTLIKKIIASRAINKQKGLSWL